MHSMEIYRAYLDARALAEELLCAYAKATLNGADDYEAKNIELRFFDVKSSTPVAMALLNAAGGRDA